ncbi:ASCH domain-containing protein [Geminisphaera colitermitum]|uniref:ASCH domain-containing protein n=1 Tax=Geminisphaera colitermitum TaxID=1148786 RepID=UPI000158C70F|nr:ASCH domain-containing protein [Geminisphaera colitermitum]
MIPPDLFKLPVLSIRQPWAWMILNAGKDVENRNWTTRFRGRFLIHAAKGCTRNEYESACEFARLEFDGDIPNLDTIPRGGIVGVAELVDCVGFSESPWLVGRYGFVLRNVQPLPFHPCKGALGFFYIPSPKPADKHELPLT